MAEKRKRGPNRPIPYIPTDTLLSNAIPEPNSGCFLWLGAMNSNGYGLARIDRAMYLAHRLMWTGLHGDPGNLLVLHRCDTPACINPAHLFIGTQTDNMTDCTAKGRNYVPNKLSEETHCRHGHLYSEANTRWYRGWRICRTCHAKNERERWTKGLKQ